MLHKFSFSYGQVSYANMFIKSKDYNHAKEKGGIPYREFATDPCRSIFSRVSSMFFSHASDNTNVNVARIAGKFIAMTETPLPVEYDLDTLETIGVISYDDKIQGNLTTALPHHDHNSKETFNYLTHFSRASNYNIYSTVTGESRDLVASVPVKEPSYMHSFGIKEHFIVLAEFPLVVNPLHLLMSGKPFIENYKWKPENGTRFTIIKRSSGKVMGRYICDAFFAFHHINAFETDNRIVIDIIAYKDNSIINSLYIDVMRGNKPGNIPPSEFRRYSITPDNGSIEYQVIYDMLELPRINYRYNMENYTFLYAAGTHSVSNFIDKLVKINFRNRGFITWSEKDCHPGEPIFVPSPDGTKEDDGMVLSVVLDSDKGHSFLLVLNSKTFEEIARAEVPHHIPFGIHGQYYGNV
jgi:carotenoid cleavage dioxygenase-like enzyme